MSTEPKPAPGDWPKDAADEDNGRYQSTCHLCGKTFIGHKRRVTCKVCATKPATGEQISERAARERLHGRSITILAPLKPAGEWTVSRLLPYFETKARMGSFKERLQLIADDISAALAAEATRSIQAMDRVQQQVNDMAKQLAAEREKHRKEMESVTMNTSDIETVQRLREQLDDLHLELGSGNEHKNPNPKSIKMYQKRAKDSA
jgi:hypothetical protein